MMEVLHDQHEPTRSATTAGAGGTVARVSPAATPRPATQLAASPAAPQPSEPSTEAASSVVSIAASVDAPRAHAAIGEPPALAAPVDARRASLAAAEPPAGAPVIRAPHAVASDAPTGPGTTAQVPEPVAPSAAVAPVASASDPHAALFAEAHRLHFTERDPARALAAWDRYLDAAPAGRFAPEARYNRALALVRLGRRVEAQKELAVFANGMYGDYRREEARALLDALARDAARP
jgi:hypothetical protein